MQEQSANIAKIVHLERKVAEEKYNTAEVIGNLNRMRDERDTLSVQAILWLH